MTQRKLYSQLVEELTLKQYTALMGGDMSFRSKAERAMKVSRSQKVHSLARKIIQKDLSVRALESYSRVTPESAEHGDFSECGMDREERCGIADGLKALKAFINEHGAEENQVNHGSARIYGHWFDSDISPGETEQRCFDLDFRDLSPRAKSRIQAIIVKILRGEA